MKQPGSMPTRISGTSPLQTYSRSQQRQPQAALSIGRSVSQPLGVPTSTSPHGGDAVEEGAFISHGKGKAPEMPSRTVSVSRHLREANNLWSGLMDCSLTTQTGLSWRYVPAAFDRWLSSFQANECFTLANGATQLFNTSIRLPDRSVFC